MDDYSERAGLRVLAISNMNSDAKTVVIFGRGVITGLEVPHGAVGTLAERIISENSPNPRIELDSGEVIWGCECWWLPEQKGDLWLMELKASGFSIKEISIDSMRRYYEVSEGRQ